MKRVVVISGAGISAESGLKTFRGTDGLWRGYRPEEVACPEAWRWLRRSCAFPPAPVATARPQTVFRLNRGKYAGATNPEQARLPSGSRACSCFTVPRLSRPDGPVGHPR
jgi:hypothetical protein